MAWPEIAQVLSYGIFSVILLHYVFKYKQNEHKQKKRKKNFPYLRCKEIVTEYLNKKEVGETCSKYDTIVKATKNIIIQRLTTGSLGQCTKLRGNCKADVELKNLFRTLFTEIEEKGEKKQVISKVLRFLLKKQTMKHPYDIVRSRRAFVMLDVLNVVLENKNSRERKGILLDLEDNRFLLEDTKDNFLLWNHKDMTTFLKGTLVIILSFFPSYVNDWVSDFLVLHGNYKLYEEVREIDFPDNSIVSQKSFLNAIPWDVAGALLVISTLVTLPKLGRLKDLINIRCLMNRLILIWF